MNTSRLSLLLLFFIVLPAWGGELELVPETISNGEVAVLRWSGSSPVQGEARFTDEVFPLARSPEGAFFLLGVDLDRDPGRYPLEVELVLADGSKVSRELTVTVNRAERPTEHLELPEKMVTPRDPEVVERILREQKILREIFQDDTHPPRYRHFILPVPDPMGSPFGLRRILNKKPRSPHAGIDFRSPGGTPVLATADGVVALTGDFFFTGRTVILDHGGGLYSIYAHLQEFLCTENDEVAAGGKIGRVGSSGRSTGPHLHWGVKLKNRRIDPFALIRLLPGKNLDPALGQWQ